jgi:hypothetical protein
MRSTGFVGRITSVNPSAMQYAKITIEGESPSAPATGNTIGMTSISFAEAEPINTCKNKIKK